MPAQSRDVAHVAGAGLKVGLVGIERFADGRRLRTVVPASIVAAESTRLLLCLPEVENAVPVRIIEIVGNTDARSPVGTVEAATHDPGASRLIAPVAQMDAGRELDENRLALNRQLKPGGAGFELRRADRTRHIRDTSGVL